MSGISQIKKSLQLSNWAEMVKECCASGKSIAQWCDENGIKVKTYYYRQNKVREAMAENCSKNEVVPIGITPQLSSPKVIKPVIIIRKNDVELELSENISSENLNKVLRALQC